jgi:signal transduction histidine kinase
MNSEHDPFDRAALLAKISALQGALAEADRAARARAFAWAAATHDLRQPAQSLVLLAAIIKRQTARAPEAASTIAAMQSAISGLQTVLAGLDDASSDLGAAPTAQSVDLLDLLLRLAAEYAPRAAAQGLALRVAGGSIWARVDPDILARILRNLIENALRYTPAGGVLLATRRRGAVARVDVIDTGVGIAADSQTQIFGAYQRLDDAGVCGAGQGTGLGLAIVARLAGQIGATIELSSKPARGARFSLALPALGAARDAPSPL